MELNKIFHQDCLDFLRSIESNTVDLVITSPPYNRNLHRNIKKNGKWQSIKLQYDNYDDNMPEDEYEKWQKTVIEECIRVLKPSGSLFYNHKENKKNGFAINPTYIYDFPIHQTILWLRNSSVSTNPCYFVSSFEYFFWLVKNPKKTYFNRNASPLRTNVWKINAERNTPHPAPFPLQIANQIVKTCCPVGGLVLDCFMGSGTTAVAAATKLPLWKNVVVWLIVILYFPVFFIIKYIIWCLSFMMINGDRIREALQELFDERYVFNGHISIL